MGWPLSLFHEIHVDFCSGPTIKHRQWATQTARQLFDQPRQPIYRLAHGLTEVFQFLPVQSPSKHTADINAKKPEFDIIRKQRVLGLCKLRTFDRKRRVRTLSDVRRTRTVPNASLANMISEILSAMLKLSMTMSSEISETSSARFRPLMVMSTEEKSAFHPFFC